VEKDSRFIYLKKENGGLSSARNAGISIAQGTFILPLDADDKLNTIYVDRAVQEFEIDASLKVVYCKAEMFGEKKGLLRLPQFSLNDLALKNLIFCSAMFKKVDWETVGGYDVNMIYGLEDWEFWIAILKNGGNVKCLDIIGFYYRIKHASMLKQLDKNKKKQLIDYISNKHADFYITQLGSFVELKETIVNSKKEFEDKLKSEKFVVDLFCSTFFKFSIFGKYKKG
jgi:glycosyltransferase involved in cell wall biosynthesis